jgi:hypothetical protein
MQIDLSMILYSLLGFHVVVWAMLCLTAYFLFRRVLCPLKALRDTLQTRILTGETRGEMLHLPKPSRC